MRPELVLITGGMGCACSTCGACLDLADAALVDAALVGAALAGAALADAALVGTALKWAADGVDVVNELISGC